MKEDLELCSKVLMVWTLNPNSDKINFDPEYQANSFIAKIIRKKFEVFQIPIKIPDPLLMLSEICTDSNPGVSQIMLKEVLSRISSLELDYQVMPMDFVRVYATEFPLMRNPKWEEHFRKLWDAQKSDGNNLCDTRDWWMELFKS